MSDLHNEIEQQYTSDQGTAFYRTVMGDGGFDIHYGLYDDPARTIQEATKASTKRLIRLVESVQPIDEFCSIVDLGSGRGGPAHELALMSPATVTCVDLCRRHQEENLQRAESLGVVDRIRTWTGSYDSLPKDWTDGFDLAWAQETFCHAQDVRRVLSEASRVLKVGGVIAFSDVMLSDSATIAQANMFAEVNAINRLTRVGEYQTLLATAGFGAARYEDWSEHLEENFRRMQQQIERHRSDLLEQGVCNDYLDQFSNSLNSRIAFSKDRVLRWGAFVADKS